MNHRPIGIADRNAAAQADFDEQHEDDELIDRIWNLQLATEGGNDHTTDQKAERWGLQLRPKSRRQEIRLLKTGVMPRLFRSVSSRFNSRLVHRNCARTVPPRHRYRSCPQNRGKTLLRPDPQYSRPYPDPG